MQGTCPSKDQAGPGEMQQLLSKLVLVDQLGKMQHLPSKPVLADQQGSAVNKKETQQLPSRQVQQLLSQPVLVTPQDEMQQLQGPDIVLVGKLQLWSEVDTIVQQEIAHTKGGPRPENIMAGRIEKWKEILLPTAETKCKNKVCKADKTELSKVILKNVRKLERSSSPITPAVCKIENKHSPSPASTPRRCIPHKNTFPANRSPKIDPASHLASSSTTHTACQVTNKPSPPPSPPRRCIPHSKTATANRSSKNDPVSHLASSPIAPTVCQTMDKPSPPTSPPRRCTPHQKDFSVSRSATNGPVSHPASSPISYQKPNK